MYLPAGHESHASHFWFGSKVFPVHGAEGLDHSGQGMQSVQFMIPGSYPFPVHDVLDMYLFMGQVPQSEHSLSVLLVPAPAGHCLEM